MHKIYTFSPIALTMALVACGGGDDKNDTTNLSIPFVAKVGATEIACGAQLTGLGQSADKGTIADFAFYIHDLKFKTKDGQMVSATLEKSDFQDPEYGVALLDFQDKTDSCNPISEEKFQLGRHLFYDHRLSGPGNFACASCHRQALALTDGLAQAIGATGQKHPRSAQALVNIAYNASVNWGNPSTVTLEQQAPIPLFNEFPVEMGVNDANQAQVLKRLQTNPRWEQ